VDIHGPRYIRAPSLSTAKSYTFFFVCASSASHKIKTESSHTAIYQFFRFGRDREGEGKKGKEGDGKIGGLGKEGDLEGKYCTTKEIIL